MGKDTAEVPLKIIARMHSDVREKFGIPRQSGMVPQLYSRIVFEPEYRDPRALSGLEDYSHLWLIWQFSGSVRDDWSALVRPPRLGGNTYAGVFATRSPFRPNPIGLSCVKIEKIEARSPEGPVITVSGADLMDQTPIYDIKPYIAFTDAHPEAVCGIADRVPQRKLKVIFPEKLLSLIPDEKRPAAIGILEQDPRPAYQKDPKRHYGISFAGFNIRFAVEQEELTVFAVEEDPA